MTGNVVWPELGTGRLLLRPVRGEHADALAAALADPAVYAFTGGTPEDAPWWRSRLAFLEPGRSPDGQELWLNWVIHLTATSEIAGYVQATVAGATADIAYVLGTRWQGHGYAREATSAMIDHLVGTLGVAQIRAWIADSHDASRAVAQRCGLSPTDEIDADGERLWVHRSAPESSGSARI
jgi:RimJ/RimL family protein N-acetyltransferase